MMRRKLSKIEKEERGLIKRVDMVEEKLAHALMDVDRKKLEKFQAEIKRMDDRIKEMNNRLKEIQNWLGMEPIGEEEKPKKKR